MSEIKGPGLLYVNSRITSSSLSEAQFLKWYTEVHIPEIIATSHVPSALRFKSPVSDVQRPYLALYPMEDIGFTKTQQFKDITVTSDLLPDGGPVYNLADFATRYYGLQQYYAPREVNAGETKMLLTAGFSYGTREEAEEGDRWYRQEHIDLFSRIPGYLRTTRYKLLYHRNNAISRQLKGFPPHPDDAADLKDPPTYLALHEFDTLNVDLSAVKATTETDWAKKVLSSATQAETPIFAFQEFFGEGNFFDDKIRVQYSGAAE